MNFNFLIYASAYLCRSEENSWSRDQVQRENKQKKKHSKLFLQIFLKASWNSYWQQQNPSHNYEEKN